MRIRGGRKGTWKEEWQIQRGRERDGKEDGKPGGKTRVKEIWKVMDRTTWERNQKLFRQPKTMGKAREED